MAFCASANLKLNSVLKTKPSQNNNNNNNKVTEHRRYIKFRHTICFLLLVDFGCGRQVLILSPPEETKKGHKFKTMVIYIEIIRTMQRKNKTTLKQFNKIISIKSRRYLHTLIIGWETWPLLRTRWECQPCIARAAASLRALPDPKAWLPPPYMW